MKALIHLGSDWNRTHDFEKEIITIDEIIELSKIYNKGVIIKTVDLEDYEVGDHKDIDMIATLYDDYIE